MNAAKISWQREKNPPQRSLIWLTLLSLWHLVDVSISPLCGCIKENIIKRIFTQKGSWTIIKMEIWRIVTVPIPEGRPAYIWSFMNASGNLTKYITSQLCKESSPSSSSSSSSSQFDSFYFFIPHSHLLIIPSSAYIYWMNILSLVIQIYKGMCIVKVKN